MHFTGGVLLASMLVLSAQAPGVEGLLGRSDVGLFTPPAVRVRLALKGPDAKTHSLEVWRSGDHKTLIRFLDPREQGKYLLRLDNQLWLLTPGAKRPVRVNASYRLYGGGTLDEVMGLRLSQQYTVESTSEVDHEAGSVVTFRLRAKQEYVQFPRVEYRVRRKTERPVSATYHLRSGKPATLVEFDQWTDAGFAYARRILVKDLLRRGAVTEVLVTDVEARAIPDALFDLADPSARRALERGGGGPASFP